MGRKYMNVKQANIKKKKSMLSYNKILMYACALLLKINFA